MLQPQNSCKDAENHSDAQSISSLYKFNKESNQGLKQGKKESFCCLTTIWWLLVRQSPHSLSKGHVQIKHERCSMQNTHPRHTPHPPHPPICAHIHRTHMASIFCVRRHDPLCRMWMFCACWGLCVRGSDEYHVFKKWFCPEWSSVVVLFVAWQHFSAGWTYWNVSEDSDAVCHIGLHTWGRSVPVWIPSSSLPVVHWFSSRLIFSGRNEPHATMQQRATSLRAAFSLSGQTS